MTNTEKLKMYQEKNKLIKKLDLVLTTPTPRGMTVSGVDYEVWKLELEDSIRYQEILVISFKGGGKLPICVTGNSNSANLRVLAENIDGGDYSFVPMYSRIKETWTLVTLAQDD